MYLKKYICFFILTLFILTMLLMSLLGSRVGYSSGIKDEEVNFSEEIINNEEHDNLKNDIMEKNYDIKEVFEENSVVPIEEDVVKIFEFNVASLHLREGIASDEVLRIRKFLEVKGYTGLEGGYYFDSKLKEAVKDYQKSNNLVSDGIIGPKTFDVINEDIKQNSIVIPHIELELPEIVPNRKWILINKKSNTLYYFNNRELINKYPVASGKTPKHTPEGKFYIITKLINPYWGGAGRYQPIRGGASNNPLGKRWLGLNIRGGGTYGIHGNSDMYSIGKYVTLGCIRMFNEDIESLFDIIEYNTPVWIVSDMTLAAQ